jgi:cobalamin-dependent methionine synthase I
MNMAKVLLVMSSELLDRARVVAGRTTTMLKLPVSLQIVLRAVLEEGLKHAPGPALVANVERQAKAIRQGRSMRARTHASRKGEADTR